MIIRAALLVLATVALTACDDERKRAAAELTGGDPARGSATIRLRGCGSCHQIPGIANADGKVGPPLAGIADRVYLAGQLPNSPSNLIQWVKHPQKVEPGTAMPELGLTDEEARDVAAYLYTLR